jgi:arginyl-tRNA synthetase
MILSVHHALRTRVADVLARLYSLDTSELPPLVIEVPPKRAMGDLGMPFAFELARRLRKAPRAIAQDVVAAFGEIHGVARVEAAPNGYVNVFLDRARFLRDRLEPDSSLLQRLGGPAPSSIPRVKTIVEHTAINPNKAAHIGHLRNSTLGDTLVRMLGFRGVPVEVQNYIDDTGVQVADVVVGFRHLEGKTLEEVRVLASSTALRFDYYCWDLYARVTEWYASDKARLQVRAETLHAIEHGEGDAAAIGQLIAERIVRCHLATMGRLNVDYDLLTWEGDILRLHFWAHCFDILKKSGSVFYRDSGRLAGCWVMRIEEDDPSGVDPELEDADPGPASLEPGVAWRDSADEADDRREKVIVRSNGTVTYVGKDIAYQFWKMGLLGRDFFYREFGSRLDGQRLWATTSDPSGRRGGQDGVPAFGDARMTYNVIDTRQSYLQKLLKQALATMGHTREAEGAVHFAYEMVALSHATARELGYEISEQDDRPFVEVSGRKGLGVKADDLLDRLVEKARREVAQRNPDMPEAGVTRTAEIIAVAALRYFMVKFSRTKVIAFDIDEALSFEGESGPYLQYSTVRANNIFNKLEERLSLTEDNVISSLASTPATVLTDGADGDDVWGLVLEASRLDEVVEQSLRSLEPALLAKYAFGLAQAFNGFYHVYPILNEERDELRRWRAAVAAYFRRQLTTALALIGSDVPARM